jgi:hypothetical protein
MDHDALQEKHDLILEQVTFNLLMLFDDVSFIEYFVYVFKNKFKKRLADCKLTTNYNDDELEKWLIGQYKKLFDFITISKKYILCYSKVRNYNINEAEQALRKVCIFI